MDDISIELYFWSAFRFRSLPAWFKPRFDPSGAMSESGLESDIDLGSLDTDLEYLQQLQVIGERLWEYTAGEIKEINSPMLQS